MTFFKLHEVSLIFIFLPETTYIECLGYKKMGIYELYDNGFNNFRFTIVDYLNYVDGLTDDEIDDRLLQKERFWIRTLVTQHDG